MLVIRCASQFVAISATVFCRDRCVAAASAVAKYTKQAKGSENSKGKGDVILPLKEI